MCDDDSLDSLEISAGKTLRMPEYDDEKKEVKKYC